VPAKDTIKTVRGGLVIDTPDRDTLWQAQTPQVSGSVLSSQRIWQRNRKDSWDRRRFLVERRGGAVRIVRGDYRNIKITTPEDIVLAEAFLAGSGQNGVF